MKAAVRSEESESSLAAPARSFRDLVVWQKAHAFVLAVYRASEEFPAAERYGVTAQLRRAAVSIPANIVEGFRRRGQSDKLRFLNIAQASADECVYFLILVNDLGFTDSTALQRDWDEVSRLLHGYMAGFQR